MRSSVPLGHKLIAVAIAVAAACGSYAFLSYREAQLASTASLSFDSAGAEQLDPGITRALDPAVALGQSILSDSLVASLVPKPGLAASSTALAIGEFRSRVQLNQPTAGSLLVRYRDPDPGQAAAITNAVAKALAGWAPSTTTAPPPAAEPQPAPAPGPQASPPTAAAPRHASSAELSLAPALRELQAQLSAADRQAGPESSLRSEHDRQRYLESQVRAAQQKLADLNSQFAHSGSAPGPQARLALIQHTLASFWSSAPGLEDAGTSAAQLRYEREQVSRDIGVVEQQQQAAQRDEAANSASVNSRPTQAEPIASPPQPAPAAALPSPPASAVASNPLHLERMATLPVQLAWWPSALIGCFCGLLYWALAFARFRSSSESDSDDLLDQPEETAPSAYCLIYPEAREAPAQPGSLGETAADSPDETPSRKRASFTFDPDSTLEAAPDQSPSPEPIHDSAPDSVDSPPEAAIAPNHSDIDLTASAADNAPPPLAAKEQVEVAQQEIGDTEDPWEEGIRKNLSQTTVARLLDPRDSEEEPTAAKGPARDELPSPSQTDRRVG